MISAIALAKALYSDFVLDLDMVACFLELHDMALDLKNTRKLSVERQSYVLPTQSASEKALTNVEEDFRIINPTFDVCCRYRRILLTAVKYKSVGDCKNWHTLLTEYKISSRVNVKYCNASTMLLYFVVSALDSVFPSILANFSVVNIGEATGLHVLILARDSKSEIYFVCDKTEFVLDRLISIPKR